MSSYAAFVADANLLPPVRLKTSTAYQNHLKEMTFSVDEIMSSQPNIHSLIGNNPLQVMYDNHRHHGLFMATVFAVGNYELLAKTLPWVYRAYHAHNFSYDYFPLELETWLMAIEKILQDEDLSSLRKVYQWMILSHEKVIEFSLEDREDEPDVKIDWVDKKNEFRTAVLRSDHKFCLNMAETTIQAAADIECFYLNVLQPVLYEVGMLWEKGKISVAQEHLASAIISRVMVAANLIAEQSSNSCGRVVVAAATNEYHEIGASMVADVLEHDGWEVDYLGANVPADALLEHLRYFKPIFLALSVTIPFNLGKVRDIITQIHQDESLRELKIMVGGRPFNDNVDLWKDIGADGFAANLSGMRNLAQKWRTLH